MRSTQESIGKNARHYVAILLLLQWHTGGIVTGLRNRFGYYTRSVKVNMIGNFNMTANGYKTAHGAMGTNNG